ncbi:unnamed protein product [Rotaria magnacalcarata]|uniref:F-box domain-containing protein n=1 Tax=Rotaria magnacalcarata TaxID=392030 RepID=A0A8S2R4P7_9BILA|nr:unnamed protein product [Rotaria magnacalcarata]
MSQNIPSNLLELPIELVYRVMDCLDNFTILYSMRNVCIRLNAIIETYNRYQKLNTLDVERQQIEALGVRYFFDALRTNNTTITALYWYDNGIKVRERQHVAHTLSNDTGDRTLCCANNNIPPLRAEQLADILQTNTVIISLFSLFLIVLHVFFKQAITALYTDGNRLGHEGAQYLTKALQTNKAIITLELSETDIGDIGAQHFADALRINNTLTSLNLHHNNIREKGALKLADALENNKTLTALFLDENRVGDKGAKPIAKALRTNKTLITLTLFKNRIGEQGRQCLDNALGINTTLTTRNPCDYKTDFFQQRANMVDVLWNTVRGIGIQRLVDTLRNNTTLTTLNLCSNKISDEDAQHLADALRTNTVVTIFFSWTQ